ncbi:trypsin-like peptidase domain-containing protein [Streptomyces sp. NPDC004959]|uniref:S1C family serine protease n=1 Tax=unclassified Streptomyces TaxID=2593676 RepID=UPI0033B44AFF
MSENPYGPSTPSAATPASYPPPPAYEPDPYAYPVEAPAAPARSRGRLRLRGPGGILTAVAVAAAVVGGATSYGLQQLGGDGGDTVRTVSGTTVSESSKGTVAGVAAAVSPAVVEISATSNGGESTGAGVVITSNGEIVTNNHVISGAQQIKVALKSGKTYTAEVVGTDSSKDLALIKLKNASGLKTATLGNSDNLQVGDNVVAIGSPEGLSGTVTSGIVSALDRDVTVAKENGGSQGQGRQGQGGGQGSAGGEDSWPFQFGGEQFNGDTGESTTTYKAIQTDASLNPGNSGGALIDMNGAIIGINSAMYSASSSGGQSSSSDAGSVGLGFAIPVNTVKADLAKLRSGAQD